MVPLRGSVFVVVVSTLVGLFGAAHAAFADRLDPDKASYVVGERIKIAVSGAPGSGVDWLGIFRASAPSPDDAIYWQYLQGGREPGSTGPTDTDAIFRPVSLPRGEYEVRLFVDGGSAPVASAPIRIVDDGPTRMPSPEGELTVLCFNIWVQGGRGHGGLPEVIRFIKSSQADVICLQECNATTLATILDGLRSDPLYADAEASGATGIISRFPIEAEYTAGLKGYGVRIALADGIGRPGERIRVFNSHLRPYPYGPYELRDGATVDEVLAIERSTRAAEMGDILGRLVQHRGRDSHLSTILVGDHNAPSHLDWTEANRDQNFGTVIDWPVSVLLHDFGFVDSYRAVHPDPVAHRALTWSPGYPKATIALDDVHDRIDMVYHRAAAGRVITPVQAYTTDRDPWPSDHRAVVVSFDLDPSQSLQRAKP